MAVKCDIIDIVKQEIASLSWGLKARYGIKFLENYIENLGCTTSTYIPCYSVSCDTIPIVIQYVHVYWGYKSTNAILSVSDIEASSNTYLLVPGDNVIANFTANNLPKYLWVAIPKAETIATDWYGALNNKGKIGTDQDLFGTPVLVSNKYNFYISNYPTQQEETNIEFRH